MQKGAASVAILTVAAAIRDATAFTVDLKITSRPASFTNDSPTAIFESFNYDEDEPPETKKKGFFANFFEELDAFVDDATSRRLGNGAQYYGKRKSSFYGKDDINKKKDRVSLRHCVNNFTPSRLYQYL